MAGILNEQGLPYSADLLTEFAGQFDALEINDAFDAVLRTHRKTANIEDFIPVLVEAEMKERLRSRDLDVPA